MLRGTRQRDLLKQYEQRDFLSYLSSFLFWRNREQSFYSIVRARAYVYVFSTFPLVYLSRYYIASSNAFSLNLGHRPFELCHVILWLLIIIRGARFV